MKLILASASPRRKAILKGMDLDFDVIPSDYEEIIECSSFSYEKIEDLAYNKAKSILPMLLEEEVDSYILGADTVVVFDNEILGKPTDENDAFKMLTKLSGNRHFVVTSICVIESKSLAKKLLSTTSYVEFADLSEDMIIDYIEKFNPLDKAGAYGIQELPEGFIKSVEGSFENIVGLCPKAVEKTFLGLGIRL